jgi:hypothetical protein
LFVNNQTTNIIYDDLGIAKIYNNIAYNNIYNTAIRYITTPSNNLVYNNYFHNDTTYTTNIDGYIDPMFVKVDTSFDNGDYRLQFCSTLQILL